MRSDEAPSNAQLGERTARIEEQVDHVSETVDRIETNLNEQHQELVEELDEKGEKVDTMWTGYRLARFLVPVAIAMIGTVGTIAGAGMI